MCIYILVGWSSILAGKKSQGLSGGATVGITLGLLVAILVVAVVVVLVKLRRRKKKYTERMQRDILEIYK